MLTAADVMTRDLIVLRVTDSLSTAGKVFQLHPVHHLPVVDGRQLVGLVTKLDYLRARAAGCDGSTRLRDFMTRPVMTVSPETPLRETLDSLLERHFGCLPVVKEDRTLVGIITRTDFVRLSRVHIEEQDAREPEL